MTNSGAASLKKIENGIQHDLLCTAVMLKALCYAAPCYTHCVISFQSNALCVAIFKFKDSGIFGVWLALFILFCHGLVVVC